MLIKFRLYNLRHSCVYIVAGLISIILYSIFFIYFCECIANNCCLIYTWVPERPKVSDGFKRMIRETNPWTGGDLDAQTFEDWKICFDCDGHPKGQCYSTPSLSQAVNERTGYLIN